MVTNVTTGAKDAACGSAGTRTPAAPDAAARAARDRLLALRRKDLAARTAAPAPIPARGAATAPASFAQRSLWLAERLHGTGAYRIATATRIDGPLDRAALRDAWSALARRQAALRTRLVETDGQPWQHVDPPGDAPFALVELAPDADGAAIDARLAADAARPFDLAREHPARATLFALAPDRHVLLLTMHHVAADGWSRHLVARELAALYAAFAGTADRVDPLPPLEVGFADIAAWQHERAAGKGFDERLAWWRDRLEGAEPAALPSEAAAAAQPLARTHRFEVPAATTHALRTLSRDAGVTLFTTLLAAFDVLMMRWTHRSDVAVATPVSGRTRAELDAVVGDLADLVVLRTDLAGVPTFREAVARASRVARDAFERQDVPFERVVAAAGLGRDGGTAPVATCFALRDLPSDALVLHGLACEPMHVDLPATAKFDLTLELVPQGDALRGVVEYAAGTCSADTARRLAAHWLRLLDAAAAAPDTPIAALTMLEDAEHRFLLDALDASDGAQASPRCIHHLIAERARETPDAIAVISGDAHLDFRELDARADRLARRLRREGATRDTLVAVCVPRSEHMVVAMLGAMKAGAGYLPIDVATPPERLAWLLEDAAPRVLVAGPEVAASLPDALRATLPVVAADSDAADDADADRPADVDAGSRPGDLVYAMYTSGSTGRPKGVLIEHRALSNAIAWQAREFGFGPADRFLNRSVASFDASCWELWTPLCVGASTVVASEDALRDPAATLALIEAHGITFTQAVPSFLALMLAELERAPRALPLRLLCVGGETLPGADARRWARVSGAALVNCYGPTEATIDATFERCPREDAPDILPIGRPVGGARVRVLDPSGALVPIGGVGELHVGGAGLARGYLGRDALTAERFVPDPYRPGERLYRTGDLARVLPDGRLCFLGRIDRQLKIAGVRIEPGEIEAALLECPGVARATVQVRPAPGGAPRLVAWIEAARADVAAIRARLADRLPAALVPAAIVALERLPELPSGKLDLAALPAPAAAAQAPVAPRSALEQAVSDVLAEVLGVQRLGVHDDFFAAGGDSLAASRAAARLRAVLGRECAPRMLFRAPTVAALAAALGACRDRDSADADAGAGAGAGAAALATAPPDGEPVPLDPAQRTIAWTERLEATGGLYNVVQAVRLEGVPDESALQHALRALAGRHGALRTRIVEDAGELVQVVEPEARLPLLRAEASPDVLDALLAREAARPFNLDFEPLARALLVTLGTREHVLLLSIHHAVVDGWSMRSIAAELAELYAARLARRAPRLPAIPMRYVDHVVARHRRLAAPDALAAPIAAWRERLGGLGPLPLPLDRPRTPGAGAAGDRVEVTLPAALALRLRAHARSRGVTPFMAMLAAFDVLLARWCAHDDVAIGTPVAGRDAAALEPLVGCFVNMLVLRTDLSGEPGFDEVLERVRRTAADAFLVPDVPFDRLVAALRPARERGVHPLFQVAFTFDDQPPAVPALQGLRCTPVDVAPAGAKFDLSLAVAPRGDALRCTFEYRSALFDRATVATLAQRLVALVAQALDRPDLPVARLAVQARDEAAPLLALGRGVDGPPPQGDGIAARVEAIARRMPDAVAVVDGARRLTYAELDARSARLARRLVVAGVTPGDTVGLCVPRSADHVIGMLAILKAAAAYLPLDAALPAARLASMLADCAVRAVVVDERAPDLAAEDGTKPRRVPVRTDVPAAGAADAAEGPDATDAPDAHEAPEFLAALEDLEALEALEDAAVLPPPADARAPAYAMFTSGSTGRPKGTRIAQAGILRLVLGTDYVDLRPGSVVAQASTCAFDAATFEIWGALLNGATLSIVPRDALLDADALASRIAADRIDTLFLTTALFNELAARRPAMFAPLRTLLFGGEAADARAVRRVLDAGPPAHLLNVYGPTETTTFATWHDLAAAHRDDPSGVPDRVPIGRPIASTDVRVIDRFGAVAPPGVAGELLVGGPGVALGYVDRPELDAERFVDDPHRPGHRLYRTGDRVRMDAQGVLEFIGRIDDQVKVRGYRIEPGEIEVALRELPGVRDAAAGVRSRGDAADRRLVAWVVPREPGARDDPSFVRALRDALPARLPEYMVPGAFVVLEALPLNANGKVDRRALPDAPDADPDASARGSASSSTSSSTSSAASSSAPAQADALETALAALWSELLGGGPVGPDDDFFELGGHSLLALRLLAAIEQRFARTLPLATLFDAPTVRALATVLRGAGAPVRRSCVVAVQPRGGRVPLVFVSGWGGQLLVFAELARALGPDQPLYVLDTAAFEADELTAATLPAVAARMLAELRALRPSGRYALCGFSLGGAFVVEIARLLRAAGEPPSMVALMDCFAPGHPRRRPLPSRIALHLRAMCADGPRGSWAHLRPRLEWLVRRVLRRRERLFAADAGVADSAVARAMQASADAMLELWRAHVPQRVEGRVLVIRAGRRELHPGTIDDDPALGWGGHADAVEVRTLDCAHRAMLDPIRSAELAALLAPFLGADPVPAARSAALPAIASVTAGEGAQAAGPPRTPPAGAARETVAA